MIYLLASLKNFFFCCRYEDVLPSGSAVVSSTTAQDQATMADYLRDAYSVFQRLELATEVAQASAATGDDEEFSGRQMWGLLRREIQKIIRSVYVEMAGLEMPAPAPLPRRTISAEVRCIPHSVYRDIRDFIVFRSIRQTTRFYHKLLRLT